MVIMTSKQGGIMANVRTIIKAAKVKLTSGRIADFQCPKDKQQAFYGAMKF
jgi:hypothetical protein